nr:sigma-70 family RNA polymerase sigma factor [Sphingomonas tagetis]
MPRAAASDGAISDESRLAALYRDSARNLSRYLRKRNRGREECDDIVHDAFARLASKGSLDGLQNPEAYLKRIIRNLLIDRSRRAATHPVTVPLEEIEPVVRPDQGDAIELEQLRMQYRAAVDALSPRLREVFLMHRVDERSVKEIAAQLGISTRTVEWHVAQAIVRIGEALDRK